MIRFLKSRSLSQWVLLFNLIVVLMITYHFENLNILLKIELSSLRHEIDNVQQHIKTVESFNNNTTSVNSPNFLSQHDVQILFSAIITIATLLFICKVYSDVSTGDVGDVSNAISNLTESIRIMDSDVKEVLKPFDQNTDLVDHVETMENHLNMITQEDAHTLSMIDLETDRMVVHSEEIGNVIENIKETVALLRHKT